MKISFHSLIHLLYPRLCAVCGRCLTDGENFLCSACLVGFPSADESFDRGEKILEQIDIQNRPEHLHVLFYYDKNSDYRKLIYAVKYMDQKKLGVYLGRMLGEKMIGQTDIEGIIPVPLHPDRERKRGYNQSLLIARGMSEVLHVEIFDKCVFRTQNNVSQTGKNTEERQKNVENIFCLKEPQFITGKHILVVDDVITTGATICSCVNALSGIGNVKISLACLGRTLI